MKVGQGGPVQTRRYRQTVRADSAARTRSVILDAAVDLALEKSAVNMSLADVAERAGVSVQTVLRHFGSRDGLLEGALEHGSRVIAAEREVPDGDVETAVRTLFDHYELRGDAVIRLLAQELFDERIALVTRNGREMHREWVRHLLPPASPLAGREDIIDQLVVVTDVYAWKILRRDRALSRAEAERRVRDMIQAVTCIAEREGSDPK